MPLHPPHRAYHEVMIENAKKIIYADEIGFDQAWVGEHFACSTEPIASPLMFMASLINQTKNITFGTGVICLPAHNPIVVAGEAAQFDHMAEGRFILGVGPGGLAPDHEVFGNTDGVVRNEMTLESIDIILKIWAQDPPYDIQGKYWQVKLVNSIIPELGMGTMSKPFRRPKPPVAMSAMSPYSGTVKTAVEHGWMPISANFCPEWIVASHFKKYVEGCKSIDRDPDGKDWHVARNMIIAESDAEAEDIMLDPKGSLYYYYNYLWTVLIRGGYTAVMKDENSKMPDSEMTVEKLLRSMVTYGSPKTVTEKLVAFRESVGPFGALLYASPDGSGPEFGYQKNTMRHLVETVRPQLNRL